MAQYEPGDKACPTHYNYVLQVWIVDGHVADCGHPDDMKAAGCCNGHRYVGFPEGMAERRVEEGE